MRSVLSVVLANLFLFTMQSASAQVTKNVMVEHFTNTRCSICASSSKNPAFYENLANYPDILHVSYHPSSPYSTCLFSQHNPAENDGRAKYYSAFGGTPRLLVQGVLNPIGVPFGSADVFNPYLDQMTEVSIDIMQAKTADDVIEATITITTESEHNYTGTKLLVAVAEKVVDYQAPNGEDVHYDVFRKAFTDIEGDELVLPGVGESVSFNYSVSKDAVWDMSQMFVYVILNDAESKNVIQSEAASPSENMTATQDFNSVKNVRLYPNPAQNNLNIEVETETEADLSISSISGVVQYQSSFRTKTRVDISAFVPGIYIVSIESQKGRSVQRIVVK